MKTYKIFLAHPSDYPKEDIDAIYAACTRASGSVLFKPTEWSDGLCDNSKTQNTLLYNDLKSSDIIFRLLYKKYKDGCGTQMEYDFAKEKGKTILTFIRVDSSEESKQLVNALRQSEGDNTGTICEYPTKEFPDLGQSVEVQLGRFLRRQKKRWWIPVAGILTGIMIFLLWLILTGRVPWFSHNTKEPEGPKTEIGLPSDNKRAAFVARIDNAESLVQQGKKSAALDTLNILAVICKPEWDAEKTRIDSLLRVLRAPKQPAYIKNACVVVSSNPDIVSHVRGKILASSCGLTFPEKGNHEWRISITEESIDTVKEFEGKTNYKSTVMLTASIMQNGKYKSEQKAEESARSYENQEKALHNARKLALDKLSAQIIEVIGQ